MSYQNTQEQGANKLPIAIAAVVLAVVVIFISYKFFTPRTEEIKLKDTPNITWMKQKALDVKGDFSKLSPTDQKKVNEYSHNYGPVSISNYYKYRENK